MLSSRFFVDTIKKNFVKVESGLKFSSFFFFIVKRKIRDFFLKTSGRRAIQGTNALLV